MAARKRNKASKTKRSRKPLAILPHDYHVAILDHPTTAGVLIAEPRVVVVVRAVGAQRVVFWNESSLVANFTVAGKAFSIAPPTPGSGTGSFDTISFTLGSSRGRHQYKPTVSVAPSVGPIAAGDPEIIVE